MLISKNAKDILSNRFKDYVQFLPVFDCETKVQYYFLNILKIIDGINYEKSKFKKLSSGLIVDVIDYEFEKIVKDIPIFKIYLNYTVMTTSIFVNDIFKKVIEDNHLEGFDFIEVWDS